MMTEAKPIASLMPSLLARKGGARPAMRPQLQLLGEGSYPAKSVGLSQQDLEALDDLGWNDMGEDAARPEIVRSMEKLTQAIAAAPAPAPASAPPRPARERGVALREGRRAAFTLRLDSEQHLRLRLACAVQNRSAQQLVCEALERVFKDHPGLDSMARLARHN